MPVTSSNLSRLLGIYRLVTILMKTVRKNDNSLLIASTDALGIAKDNKANRSELPSLAGYLNNVVNDATDLSNPKLIVLGTNGNALCIDYATLRSVLSQKANASAIPDVSGFINAVSNYADSNTYITLSKTGQTLSVAYPNLVTALNNLTTTVGQKQNNLTAKGDAAAQPVSGC